MAADNVAVPASEINPVGAQAEREQRKAGLEPAQPAGAFDWKASLRGVVGPISRVGYSSTPSRPGMLVIFRRKMPLDGKFCRPGTISGVLSNMPTPPTSQRTCIASGRAKRICTVGMVTGKTAGGSDGGNTPGPGPPTPGPGSIN